MPTWKCRRYAILCCMLSLVVVRGTAAATLELVYSYYAEPLSVEVYNNGAPLCTVAGADVVKRGGDSYSFTCTGVTPTPGINKITIAVTSAGGTSPQSMQKGLLSNGAIVNCNGNNYLCRVKSPQRR